MHTKPWLDVEQLHKAIHKILKAWHKTADSTTDPLAFLLVVRQLNEQDGADLHQTIHRFLLNCLEELSRQDGEAASLLQQRFIERQKVVALTSIKNASQEAIFDWQEKAIRKLSVIVYRRETAVLQQYRQQMEEKVPTALRSLLYGVESSLPGLLEILLNSQAFWLVALCGIGGSGKSSLAFRLVDEVIDFGHFEDIVWITAVNQDEKENLLPGEKVTYQVLKTLAHTLNIPLPSHHSLENLLPPLRRYCKSHRCLVIVDNLETPQAINHLLEHLATLITPSKFLLTSRAYPLPLSHPDWLHIHTMTELPLEEVAKLVAGIFRPQNNQERLDMPQIQSIYNLVGGHPQAIRLVIRLLEQFELADILNDLVRATPGDMAHMYRRIYWLAWQTLSPQAQQLLKAMLLTSEETGAGRTQLLHNSGLEETQLGQAMTELIDRFLLEVRGTIQQKRYNIHRLTRTFLSTEIVKWPGVA